MNRTVVSIRADADFPSAISRWAVPVLIVDDDSAKRLALRSVLDPLGYYVVEADSGRPPCVM